MTKRTRRNHAPAGKSGFGRGREDAGQVGAAVRCPPRAGDVAQLRLDDFIRTLKLVSSHGMDTERQRGSERSKPAATRD
jgi:hypothetical protein